MLFRGTGRETLGHAGARKMGVALPGQKSHARVPKNGQGFGIKVGLGALTPQNWSQCAVSTLFLARIFSARRPEAVELRPHVPEWLGLGLDLLSTSHR